jgi:DNA-binding SARP family transcriptional activator
MLFGHVSAEVRGRNVDLGPPAQRALFGLLALYAPAAAPYETIVATLWPDDPPRSARATVQKYVQRLRAVLGPECPPRQRGHVLRTCGDTYALTIERERVDVSRFRARFAHVAVLRAARDPAYEAALADVIDHADDPVALDVPLLGASPRVLAVKAEQAKLVDWYADLRIAAGRADEVVGLVREQAALRPLDEDSQARLIAVYRQIGCRSAAVDVYLRARRHLSDILGLDPGPELEDAYRSVLGPAAAVITARA